MNRLIALALILAVTGVAVAADAMGLWNPIGEATNHLVGFMTPVPTNGDPFTILGQLECLALDLPMDGDAFVFHGADPPSIPGHDGPVVADGVNPDNLIACGCPGGTPAVTRIGWVDATREQTWTGVEALFD